MRITLLKDVLLTSSEVGRTGESHTVSKDLALHLLREGFAKEAGEGTEATAEAAPKTGTKPKGASHATTPPATAGTVTTAALGTIETK